MKPAADPAPDVDFGFREVVAGILIAFAAWTIGASVVLSITGHTQSGEQTLVEATVLQTFLWVGYLGVPLWVARHVGLRAAFGLEERPLDIPVGVVLGVVCQLAVGLLYWPITRLVDVDVSEQARDVVDRAHGAGIVLLVVTVVLGAPFVEELFFRGLLYRVLDRRYGSMWAVVGASGVWAALHIEPVQFVGLFLFGLVLGELVHRTGRLGPAIWTHVGFNGATVAFLLLTR